MPGYCKSLAYKLVGVESLQLAQRGKRERCAKVWEAKRVQVREAEAGFHSGEMRLDLSSQCSSIEACILHRTNTRVMMSRKVMALETDVMLTLICR